MKRALFFAFIAALILIPTAVAYAHGEVKGADTDSMIESANESVAPRINIFGNAIGDIKAGELFTINAPAPLANASFTLSISNIDELTRYFRSISFNIGVYTQTDNVTWHKITTPGDGSLPEMMLTMQNSSASFILSGNTKYKITVEKGCYYSFSISEGHKATIPQFCLTTG